MDQDENNHDDGEGIEVIELDEIPPEWDETDEEDAAIDDEIPFKSDAKATFAKHTDAVMACDIEPNGLLAASGGQDDHAYVWNTVDGTVKFECTGHNDTVIFTGFSFDGQLLATADMNGNVKAWSVSTGKQIWNSEASEIVWAQWHHAANVLMAGTSDGAVWMWSIPGSSCKIFPPYGRQSDAGKFLPDGKRAVIGFADGMVKVIDLKTEKTLHHFKGRDAHQELVSSVDCYHDNILAATGSQDGTTKLLNTQTGKVIATFACGESTSEGSDGVECITFSSQDPVCAAGTINGILSIWDLPTQTQKLRCDSQAGVVRLLWHSNSFILYAACLDGVVRTWDARSGSLEQQWTGHRKEILDMAFAKNGHQIVTASEDKTCCIFAT